MSKSTTVAMAENPIRYHPLHLEQDPYPIYQRLRDEAPIYAGHTEQGPFWAVSRFDDVQAAARDWKTFSNAEGNDFDDTGMLFAPAGELTSADPPLHKRLRDAVRKEFGIAAVRRAMDEPVRTKVAELIDRVRVKETADLAVDLAYPLPAAMISSWLGFPEQDHGLLTAWHGAMLERVPGQVELPEAALAARDEMRGYVKEAMADRRSRPRDDLLSLLVAARDDGALSEDEVLGMTLLLYDAGVSTTSALISSAFLHLCDFPEQRRLLHRTPELAPQAVEEFLRFDAPFQWFTRVTTRDIQLGGIPIPKGGRVVLIWASANRDERRWEDPDELRLMRDQQRHVSFGEGIHHCLGAPLARLEASILFAEVMPLLQDYEVSGAVQRRITPSERTISSLPVNLHWARGA